MIYSWQSKWAWAFACAVLLGNAYGAAPTNVFYKYDIVAETGAGFTGFEQRTSINDNGQVGFVGQLNNSSTSFESIYRGDGSAAATLLSSGFSGATRDFSGFIQINNAGEVVARDRVSGSPILTFIRKWSGGGATVSRSGVSPDNFDSVNIPNINNAGEVSYVGLKSSPNVGEVHLSTSAGDLAVATYAGLLSPRPMLADSGDIVYRDPSNRIVVWNRTGTQVTVIAAASSGFSNLRESPGISDDGTVVGIIGDRGQGLGVFVSIANGAAPRVLVRVAGEIGGATVGVPDLGYDAAGGPIRFSTFDTLARVGVLRLPASASGNPGQQVLVCFAGTPTKGKDLTTGDHDVFSDQAGIWMTRLDLQTSPSVQAIKRPSVPVVQVGDTIGSRVITGLAVHDPIAKAVFDDSGNSCPPTRPDHWMCFWASTASGQFVARVVPFPIVVYPPVRQGNSRWATHRYAPKQVDEYLNSLPEPSAERTALQAVAENINLRQKGCLLSSYAMALNFLSNRTDLTTDVMHEAFKAKLTKITKTTITAGIDATRAGQMSGILKWKPPGTMNVPVFNGADVLHPDVWNTFHVEGTPTDDGIDHTITDDVDELATANRQGHPVLLNIHGGGHWVMSKGITGCSGNDPLFDVVDPGSSSGALDGPKTAGNLNLKKGIILKRHIVFPAGGGAALAAFGPKAAEPAQVSVQTEGAVNVLITLPNGQRVGYQAGIFYTEIPQSTYSPEFPISDPDNDYDDAETAALLDYGPRIVQFESLVDETVSVAVTASLAGPFALRFGGSTLSDVLGSAEVSGFLPSGGSTNLTVQIKTPAPLLFVVGTSGNTVTVAWPVTCPTCAVEAATVLGGPWSAVTDATTVSGTNYTVVVSRTLPQRFFRLAK